ncbi:hypothetical protein F5X99DRAFT_380500 [Biscogniauxia marginata]|nr:hypothetical protein F5X99DRAFT_380500 [Biscogniauxia marginata]
MVEGTTEETVKVGDSEYVVDIGKIPYFASFLRFQRMSRQCSESAVPEHDDLPFFATINHAVKHGYRHFFRGMSDNLADYQVLCETLERLAVDVLGGAGLKDVFDEIRSYKAKWFDDDELGTNRRLRLCARDAAFKLLYMFILGEFEAEAEVRDSQSAFNAALFVVSHPATFRCRTRKMVRRAFEDRFSVSEKQRKVLDKWPVSEPEGNDEWREEEMTTESEESLCDSDDCWSIDS